LEKLAKCEVNGNTYYEGEKFDVGSYSCICHKDFGEKKASENKNCSKMNCLIELHHYNRTMKGCIPIFYETHDSCPIGWRCPDSETKVITGKTLMKVESDLKCTFGKLKMEIGDQLSPDKYGSKCIVCSCSIPPHPYCIQSC
jgi:hypothetical protein